VYRVSGNIAVVSPGHKIFNEGMGLFYLRAGEVVDFELSVLRLRNDLFRETVRPDDEPAPFRDLRYIFYDDHAEGLQPFNDLGIVYYLAEAVCLPLLLEYPLES
jgi:hypothetical protein